MVTNHVSIPVSLDFRWDGTTSDLAQQYYRRFKAGDVIPQRTYTNLPDAITSRLQDIGTTFDKLPGLLQRALVWDSGYVENGKSPNELVRVQTLHGVSMAEIAISLPQYQNLAGCTAYTCTQPDGALWYKNDKCSSTDLLTATRCLVDSFGSGDDPHLAIWSTGGNDTAIPSMRLLKHEWSDNIYFYDFSEIYTAEEAVEPKYDQCVLGSSNKALMGAGSLVIACESPGSISAAMKANMTAPKRGDLVSAWLQQYAVMPADGAPAFSPALMIPTPIPERAAQDTLGLVILIGSVVVIVPIIVGFIIRHFLRRRSPRSEDEESHPTQDRNERGSGKAKSDTTE